MPKHCINLAVDIRPVAYWSRDIEAANKKFLEGFDPRFFSEQIEWLTPQLEGDHRLRAATAIRLLYGHALETFFALVGAAVQAPLCPLAWMISYQNAELRSVVSKLSNDELEYVRLQRPLTWSSLSTELNHFTLEDPLRDSWVKAGFANAWARFGREFCDAAFVDEHNSLKHGMRVTPGGFSLRISPRERSPGEDTPEAFIDSKSEFGSRYFSRRQLGDRCNITGDNSGRNWNPIGCAIGVELLALSINNVIAFLQQGNGIKGGLTFKWPTGPENAFEAPFVRDFMVASMREGSLNADDIEPRSADEILATYDSDRLPLDVRQPNTH